MSDRGAHPPVASVAGRPVVQVAYHVADVHAAVERWQTTMGAGPFVIRDHIPVFDVQFRGTTTAFDHTSAYGQWGTVMVELFHQHNSEPTAVRERFGANDQGLHHLAVFCDEGCLGAELANLNRFGWPTAMIATTGTPQQPGQQFAFVDATTDLGHYVEVYEATPRLLAFYEHIRTIASRK